MAIQNIINSIKGALDSQNYYAALLSSLTLPDICCSIEYGKTNGNKYSCWWDKYATPYQKCLSGDDCYSLRCAALHEGRSEITTQRMKDVLDHYVFLTSGCHRNLFSRLNVNGKEYSFLQLNVEEFCNEVIISVENWIVDMNKKNDPDINNRMNGGISIHEPGYVHLGVIRFG